MRPVLALLLAAVPLLPLRAADVKPIKALLISGGCCHDYTAQKSLIAEGLKARANIEVDVIEQGGRATDAKIDLYKNADWAKGYDVVLHDECFANVKDLDWVQTILKPHKDGTPAVNIHCAMHCYRTGKEDWFEFVGVQSTGHGPQKPIEITFVDNGHPAVAGIPNWTTGNEELYNNKKVFPTVHPVAKGKQGDQDVLIAWTNEYGPNKTRVFSTTLAHNNSTTADPRFLDMVTRATLWSCDKLNDQYLKAAAK